MLGAALLVLPAAAIAEEASPLAHYVQARAASSAGDAEQASAAFAAILASEPDNELVAAQALSHAVAAGDWTLALAAARTLERRNALQPDVRFLLLADAFRSRDWARAEQQIDLIEREQLFGFAVPVLRAWRAQGSRRGDPMSFLPEEGLEGASASYAAEHRTLIGITRGQVDDPQRIISELAAAGSRSMRLRFAAAAALGERRKRAAALALLDGQDPATAAARALLERRQLRGAIDTPAAGLAELLVRLSLDLHAQNLTPLALSFTRIATWLAPENSESWMVAAELLAQRGHEREAIALLDRVAASDPFGAQARDLRVRLLVQAEEGERALAQAAAAVEGPAASMSDWLRLGEVQLATDRPAEAATAFARAIETHRPEDQSTHLWALWLMRGSAHDQADQWPEAKAALEEAYRLAPEQPLVLNYLGYAQLERRENVEEAERLVREAHRLAPDSAAITDSLGWALFLKGQLPEAIQLLEQAAQGEPADVEINEHLGDAYYAAGRRNEARFAWRAALVYAEGEDAERLNGKIRSGPRIATR
ncbi:MAG TPA: tetratricopeptide repeat protein [Allosphingosinicella sp.]|nr:tetratricopeptide repeat protein [Allosphingosinicella sp.]